MVLAMVMRVGGIDDDERRGKGGGAQSCGASIKER